MQDPLFPATSPGKYRPGFSDINLFPREIRWLEYRERLLSCCISTPLLHLSTEHCT
jgi:hypothetical protein